MKGGRRGVEPNKDLLNDRPSKAGVAENKVFELCDLLAENPGLVRAHDLLGLPPQYPVLRLNPETLVSP
jgi:hypothetical protein